MPEDTHSRLLRYLNDAYAMAQGGIVTHTDIADRATFSDLKRFETQQILPLARSQSERLARRITELGGKPNVAKGAVDAFVAHSSRFVNVLHDQADKETQDAIKAYSLTHFEIATYTSLYTYSRAIGDEQTALLADTFIAEKRPVADQYLMMVPPLAVIPARQPAMASPASGGSGSGGGLLSALAIPALLVGGTALAVWGASKLKSGGSTSGNGFNTPVPYTDATLGSDTTLVSTPDMGEMDIVDVVVVEMVDDTIDDAATPLMGDLDDGNTVGSPNYTMPQN